MEALKMGKIKRRDRIIFPSQEFFKANYPIKKSKELPLFNRIEKKNTC